MMKPHRSALATPEEGMRIGALSARTGVSPRALRYYEEHGLLAPDRAANGYREYGERDAIRAVNIRTALSAGLTVDDISSAVSGGCFDEPLETSPTCLSALRVATDRLTALDDRIRALQSLRRRLAEHVDDLAGRVATPEHH